MVADVPSVPYTDGKGRNHVRPVRFDDAGNPTPV